MAYVTSSLAEFYFKYGKLDKALENNKKALEIRKNKFGEEHATVALSYFYVGKTYMAMGDYSKALENHQKALDIRKKVLKPGHQRIKNSEKAVEEAKQKLSEQKTK